MSHIYLCYSNQDKEMVDLIQDDLKERGYVVWRDTTHIEDGQDWQAAIEGALTKAYTVVVDSCNVPDAWRETAVEIVSFVGVYRAGLEESGLEQLRQYRQAMHTLTETLDKIYPVRIYLQELRHSSDQIREHAAP